MTQAEFIKKIEVFLPNGSAPMVADWIRSNPVSLAITRDRTTKLGDCRLPMNKNVKPRITVNGGLNPYNFLITLIHECAHAVVFLKYGHGPKPHGEEWKMAYQQLMLPYLQKPEVFPEPLHKVLVRHMRNPSASANADAKLVNALAAFDAPLQDGMLPLSELPQGCKFELNGSIYIKEEKRRTRFFCTELSTKKKYTVSATARVKNLSI